MTRKNNTDNITSAKSQDAMAYVMRIEAVMNNDNIELYRELRRILSYDSVYVRDTYDFGHASMYLKNSFDIELGGVKIFSIFDFGKTVSMRINGRKNDRACSLPYEMMRALLYRVHAVYHRQCIYEKLGDAQRKTLGNTESMIQIPQNRVVVAEYDVLPGGKKRPLCIKLVSPDNRELLSVVFCEMYKEITMNGTIKSDMSPDEMQYIYDMMCERAQNDVHRLEQEYGAARVRQDMLNIAARVQHSY